MEINKIHNIDALDGLHLLQENSIDLILTDPPYGMSFQSNHRKEKHLKIVNDDDLRWLPVFVFYAYRCLKENAQLYVFCGKQQLEIFIEEFKKFFDLKNILIWNKNNTSMGDLEGSYADRTEFILFLSKGKSLIRGRRDDNVLSFNRTNNKLHPTQKPVDLLRYLIQKSSDEGSLVLDPFMGSGSTAEACKNTGRNYIGFEIESLYIEVCEKRLSQRSLLEVN